MCGEVQGEVEGFRLVGGILVFPFPFVRGHVVLYLGRFACEDCVFCLEMAVFDDSGEVMASEEERAGWTAFTGLARAVDPTVSLQFYKMHMQEVSLSLQPSHVKKMGLYQVESEHVVVVGRDWISDFEIRERAKEIGSPAFWKQICKCNVQDGAALSVPNICPTWRGHGRREERSHRHITVHAFNMRGEESRSVGVCVVMI